ncbi:keratin, type I cytoskeletal 9-like [Cheilinus undulatus]|uniref:keratin, type I cytoskeletal 9-like n=1 Tax=Cheilinus undulatus TaxID=241271 RepID=UPI001BD30728|nr:keratin, type I cytoskeletal 9-like [Cheilinus undulatus]
MRVLWVLLLLIGSITCIPMGKGSVSNSGAPSYMPLSSPSFFGGSGSGGSSDLGSSSNGPSLSNPSSSMAEGHTGGSVGFGAETGEYGAAYAPSGGYEGYAPGSSYGGYDAGAYEGESSSGLVSAPGYESWSAGSSTGYGEGAEEPQQVFSDVSELEPVYAFSSRSSYQRGRAVFAQTRYTPGEPVAPPMPIYKPVIKIPVQPSAPVKQSPPVKAPTKGGY